MVPENTSEAAVAETSVMEAAATEPEATGPAEPETVSQEELNSWRRGFTPQAEIWNGRLAMLGLSVGISVLIIARLAGSLGS